MKHKWKILNIVHSGTKGERGTQVTDEKYYGVINSIVSFDPNKVVVGYSFTFFFKSYHELYDWWAVSAVQKVDFEEEDGVLIVETLNAIYYFEDLGEYKYKYLKAIDKLFI